MTPDPAADETLRLRVQAIKYLGAYINAYELVDPDGFDFRPKEGSSLIGSGKVIQGVNDDFEGDAPDVGAYEYGGERWVAGCRSLK